jgi:hypothetical protein
VCESVQHFRHLIASFGSSPASHSCPHTENEKVRGFVSRAPCRSPCAASAVSCAGSERLRRSLWACACGGARRRRERGNAAVFVAAFGLGSELRSPVANGIPGRFLENCAIES